MEESVFRGRGRISSIMPVQCPSHTGDNVASLQMISDDMMGDGSVDA